MNNQPYTYTRDELDLAKRIVAKVAQMYGCEESHLTDTSMRGFAFRQNLRRGRAMMAGAVAELMPVPLGTVLIGRILGVPRSSVTLWLKLHAGYTDDGYRARWEELRAAMGANRESAA